METSEDSITLHAFGVGVGCYSLYWLAATENVVLSDLFVLLAIYQISVFVLYCLVGFVLDTTAYVQKGQPKSTRLNRTHWIGKLFLLLFAASFTFCLATSLAFWPLYAYDPDGIGKSAQISSLLRFALYGLPTCFCLCEPIFAEALPYFQYSSISEWKRSIFSVIVGLGYLALFVVLSQINEQWVSPFHPEATPAFSGCFLLFICGFIFIHSHYVAFGMWAKVKLDSLFGQKKKRRARLPPKLKPKAK